MEVEKARETLMSKFIGRRARVTTKNDRVFQGKIMCIDYKANVIMHESIAEIPSELNCPLNYDLYNYADSKMYFEPPKTLSIEEQQKVANEYSGSHFYFGSIMVTGSDIAKLELSDRPEQPEKEGQKEQK